MNTMRLTTRLGLLSLLTILLCSCLEAHKEDSSDTSGETTSITITANSLSDFGTSWDASDNIAVIENNTTIATASAATLKGDGRAEFSLTVAKDSTSAGFCYDAIYPAEAVTEGNDEGTVIATLSEYQRPQRGTFDRESFVMVAERVTSHDQPSEVDMYFSPIVAVGALQLSGLGEERYIEEISIEACGADDRDIMLTGDIEIDLAGGGKLKYNPWDGWSEIYLDICATVDTAMPIYFCCTPCQLRPGDSLRIEIVTDEASFASTVTVAEGQKMEFKAGQTTPIDIHFTAPLPPEDDGDDDYDDDYDDDDPVVPPTPSDNSAWLELPAEESVVGYPEAVTITIWDGDDRNYTHLYDIATYTSLWVAYPLESRHMGSYSRPGGWDWNPNLSTDDQVNLCSRSYAGDYSRGHLIPNASRNGIRNMQLQTFYVTNSVPQIQGGFNGGIWQKLEAAIQSEAESEMLYVVTGVAFNKVGESKTIKYTKAKDDTKDVPVPNYFYKVVLKVKYDNSGEVCDAQSVGFWFEHRTYSDSYTNYSVSVDDIEAWTGFDYFAALPDSIEASAEKNSSWSRFTMF